MAPVLALIGDLLFLSRVREAARPRGIPVRAARSAAELVSAGLAEPPRLVVVDLDDSRLAALDAVAALRAEPGLAAVPVAGFLSHVHGERAAAARESGVTRVLARSAFVQELPALLEPAGCPPPPDTT
jgi:CheY-like chemotaxis protein